MIRNEVSLGSSSAVFSLFSIYAISNITENLQTLHGGGAAGYHEAASQPSVAHSQPVQRPSKRVASEPASTFECHEPVTQRSKNYFNSLELQHHHPL